MKKKTGIIILWTAVCLALMTGVWLYFYQKGSVSSGLNDCFRSAVSNHLNMRWKRVDLPIYIHVSAQKTNDSIVARNENGVRKLPAFEKTMSEDEKYKSILQTTLRVEKTIDIDILDSAYRAELEKQRIFVVSSVCYTDKISGEVCKSSSDSSYYNTSYLVSSIVTGIENEIVFQAFANVTFLSVIRSSPGLFFGWLFICIVSLFSVVLSVSRNPKQIVAVNGDELLKKEGVEIQIRDGLLLNTELHVLEYGKLTKKVTEQSVSLLKLFLSHKDHFLSNDDIRDHLWGAIDYSDSCRNQAVKRLRDSLAEIPVLHIENVRGVGFRLIIDKEE